MSALTRQSTAAFASRFAAMSTSLCVVCGAVASASPTRSAVGPLRAVPISGVAIRAVRTSRAPVFRFAAVPMLGAFTFHRLPEPIHALPLVVRPQPVVRFATVLPQLGFAALIAPLGTRACGGVSRRVPIETIPSTPFVPQPCAGPGFNGDTADVPPTSLTAGHNKNALYGRAYSPAGDGTH